MFVANWELTAVVYPASSVPSIQDIPHFSKPRAKFIEQMICGIQAGRDVKLSVIARSPGSGQRRQRRRACKGVLYDQTKERQRDGGYM